MGSKYIKKETKNCIKRDKQGRFIYQNVFNENFFDEIREKQAWLIGFLVADGFINKDNRILTLAQSGNRGLELIQYVIKLLDANFHIYKSKTMAKNSYQISFISSKFVEILAKFNIVNKKSLIYQFPKTLKRKYIKDFIRGYIEGDGCIGIFKTNTTSYLLVSFVGTEQFINACQEKIFIKGNIRKLASRNCYEIRWNGEKAIKISNWIYSTSNLFEGHKYRTIQIFIKNHKPRYLVYKFKREQAKKLYFKGITYIKLKDIGKKVGIHPRTIYQWRKEWIAR